MHVHARDRNVDVINVNLAVSQNTLARFSNHRSASFGFNCARNCDSKLMFIMWRAQLVSCETILIVLLVVNTELCHVTIAARGLSKIKIDSSSRLYVEEQTGRYRMFHGLALENSGSPWYYATYTSEQIKLLKQWGLNVVRSGFHWHMVEPSPGQYNDSYIQDIVDFVSALNESGVYVIMDMHQDLWSPYFCGGHGVPPFDAHPYNTSEYNRGGKKAYPLPVAQPQYDPSGKISNCHDVLNGPFGWATGYITYATGAAAQRLYDDDKGILDRFGMFWKLIASKLKHFPNVLGYELLNEPWLGNVPLDIEEFVPANPHWNLWFPGVADKTNMQKLYSTLHDYIREVDNDTIIFFEPATGGNFLDGFHAGFEEGPGGPSYNDKQALSYHVYCLYVDTKQTTTFLQQVIANLSIVDCDLLDNYLYDNRRDDTQRLSMAGFLTEFGNAGRGQAAEDVIDFATSKMDEFLHGWTYWYLTPDPNNLNPYEIKSLARPYVHALAGVPVKMNFNPVTKVFSLVYIPSNSDTTFGLESEVYISEYYQYPNGFDVSVVPPDSLNMTYDKNSYMMYWTHTMLAKTATEIDFTVKPKSL